jgi:prepilin-type N-terminal cleavage/methylation domain-containing protein
MKKILRNKGLTLIEVIIASVIMVIIILGALSVQYYSAVHNKIAWSNLTATRTAQLLLEDWKSTGGSPQYKPDFLQLGFIPALNGSKSGYSVVVNGLPMFVILQSSEVSVDNDAGVKLRNLEVRVSWRRDNQNMNPGGTDPYITMSTYVRNDISGG